MLMDLKQATTLASVTVMTFMLAGGYFVDVSGNNEFTPDKTPPSLSHRKFSGKGDSNYSTLCLPAESPGVRLLDPVHVIQLPHLQAPPEGAVPALPTLHQRNRIRQRRERSERAHCYGIWLPIPRIHLPAEHEADWGINKLHTVPYFGLLQDTENIRDGDYGLLLGLENRIGKGLKLSIGVDAVNCSVVLLCMV